MLVVVPVCQILIDEMGWRTAYRVLGTACGIVMLPTAIFLLVSRVHAVGKAKSIHELEDSKGVTTDTSITPRQAFRSPAFWLLFLAFFGGSTCSQTLHVHQVAFLVDHGIGALVAASVVSRGQLWT